MWVNVLLFYFYYYFLTEKRITSLALPIIPPASSVNGPLNPFHINLLTVYFSTVG